MRLLLIMTLYLAPAMNVAGERTWDVLLFTQEWPIASCISHMQHDPSGACSLFPNMTSWTIHGIWPTKLGTRGPNFCNNSWHFEEKELTAIEPYLLKYWGNIYAGDSSTSFWKHEWSKHGTCAAQLPQLDSEKKYFQKGLDWVMEYDILAALTKNNILPSDLETLSIKNIFQAVKVTFGVDPVIDCIYDKKRKQHVLSEVQLCFNKSLTLVECDDVSGIHKSGNCPHEGITYPATVRNAGKIYRYPRRLAVAHTHAWVKAKSVCNSWVCRALVYLYILSLVTL